MIQTPYEPFVERLEKIKARDLLRSLKDIEARQDKTITYKNRTCLNLSSNDYLGLARDIRFFQERRIAF